jgi:hypothetical protein
MLKIPTRALRPAASTVLAAVAATTAGLSLAGCSSSPAEGTLTGTLQAVGGAAGTGPRALGGVITFHGSQGNIATLDLGANGRFSAHLPVGSYTVSGRSPQFDGGTGECQASGPVTVTKGVTSRVEVDCQES